MITSEFIRKADSTYSFGYVLDAKVASLVCAEMNNRFDDNTFILDELLDEKDQFLMIISEIPRNEARNNAYADVAMRLAYLLAAFLG